jgi:ribosome biogenesis GTPase A
MGSYDNRGGTSNHMVKRYVWNLLISVDQLINALLAGAPDETLSSRMGKHVRKNDCVLCKIICRLLNIIDKGHCERSIEEDEGL